MKKYMSLCLTLFLAMAVSAQSAGDLFEAGRALENQGNENAAFEKYVAALGHEANHLEAACGASYLASRIGYRQGSKSDRTTWYRKAEKFADQALGINEESAEANYVKALAMGRIAQIAGSKEAVAASRDIKKHADKAVKLAPQHAGAWHLLGKWHFTMANLSGAKRAAANMLFGGIPDGASNDKAVQCIRKAIELRQNYVLYYLDLARVYEKMGKEDVAKKLLEKGMALPNSNIDDPEYKKEMKEMMEEL